VASEYERETELPERWSTKAKTDVVLGLLRGEGVDSVRRELRFPTHELEAWWRTFGAWLLERLAWYSGRGRCALTRPMECSSRRVV
jgi:hypothetical protein